MKTAVTLVSALLVASVLTATALAHNFQRTTWIEGHKVPEGTTAPESPVVIWGKVHSGRSLCIRNRVVLLRRVATPGPDPIIERDVTDRQGEYLFVRRPTHDQRVYAKVKRLDATSTGHSHTCFASRTRNILLDVQ